MSSLQLVISKSGLCQSAAQTRPQAQSTWFLALSADHCPTCSSEYNHGIARPDSVRAGATLGQQGCLRRRFPGCPRTRAGEEQVPVGRAGNIWATTAISVLITPPAGRPAVSISFLGRQPF